MVMEKFLHYQSTLAHDKTDLEGISQLQPCTEWNNIEVEHHFLVNSIYI